jgi:hypothetical protein
VGLEYQGQNGKARPHVLWVVDLGTAPHKDGREQGPGERWALPVTATHWLRSVTVGQRGAREELTVTLHIVEIRGRAMWWTWVIRDSTGVLVEESRTQFRSAAEAELRGRARIADLENRR